MNEQFDGVVLFKRPYKEKDLLVKIFTQPYGTKMFYIRRGQSANHSLAPQLMPMTYNQYIGTINEEGLSFIKEATTLSFYPAIQGDPLIYAYGTYLLQLVDASLPDETPSKEVYQMLLQVLQRMNVKEPVEILINFVELHLLKEFGVNFDWRGCAICHRQEGPFDFSVRKNGLLCQEHWIEDPVRLHIDPKAVGIARVLALVQLTQIDGIKVSPYIKEELRRLIDEIYEEYVGIRLRAKSYLDKLNQPDEFFKKQQALLKKRNHSSD
ncbi:DNA repair protein RecO [Dolosicoccus paucivorans]|uniref:DNA repair protein RecO n=1 Tax=Dolosicoccus paucivorans TaxID=84521 RepID=UPI00088AE5CD|nr:DNA repair protein RecO [Dolosicoccus paucivorans]SDI31125.1 DNA replication and repair protein RecO [Dolosicoccus paucivorans]